ncbi:MAG: V0D/AC39 family V-type ATPase subunit [Oscillospiraceae bacterium]
MSNRKHGSYKKGKYYATVAKIRAMYGKRVTAEDYSELVTKQSVAEIADYLKKNTHYSTILASVDVNTIHRGFLESLLQRYNFELYGRITGFERIGRQEFYNFKIISAEIDIILSCMRFINAESEGQIKSIPIYLNGVTSFDLIEIAKVRSYAELLEFLKKTHYYELLKDVPTDENGRIDCGKCEYILRSDYYERLVDASKHYHKAEADKLDLMIHTDIDLINIINAYRMKEFFGSDENEIFDKTFSFEGRMSNARLAELYSSENGDEFIKRFSKTYYGRVIAENGLDSKDADDLELAANKLRFKYAKAALRDSQAASVSVYAFMYLMGVELHNLISIIEGVRYGVPSKQIESLIIV